MSEKSVLQFAFGIRFVELFADADCVEYKPDQQQNNGNLFDRYVEIRNFTHFAIAGEELFVKHIIFVDEFTEFIDFFAESQQFAEE